MLVITRKCNQSTMIGDEIEVTIANVTRDKVRLQIVAPKHIPIHPREIYDTINIDKSNSIVNELTDASEPINYHFNQYKGKDHILIFHRKRDQSIMIGDEIEIIVVDLLGAKVRLGIVASKDVLILRQELYDATIANCS